jgi:hypothetical protein
MIKDFIPARSSLASGIVIKQTLLERNKYPVPQLNTYTTTSYQNQNQPFISQDLIISGSPVIMYHITGSNGGSMPNLFGETSSVDLYSPITQVWSGVTPSTLGPVVFTESAQYEFFNGELSGSEFAVTTQSLNGTNPFLQVPTTLVAYTASITASSYVSFTTFLTQTPPNGNIFLFYDSSSVI